MHIAANKKEAASYIHTRIDNVKLFSDRLGYKGKIGTAVVIPDPRTYSSSNWDQANDTQFLKQS
jgi:hypothetical protein